MNAEKTQSFSVKAIGHVHSPYTKDGWTPSQPLEREAPEGAFKIVLDPAYVAGLKDLESFSHLYILAYLHQQTEAKMTAHPPWAKGLEVGLFASRSPRRVNPIALSIVKLLKIEGNELYISPVDLYNETPVLDIKPYMKTIDSRPEANDGWAERFEDKEHILEHVRGIPHDHHHHGHAHSHGEGDHSHHHEHKHTHADGTSHSHGHHHHHVHDESEHPGGDSHPHQHKGDDHDHHDHHHGHAHSHGEGDHSHHHEHKHTHADGTSHSHGHHHHHVHDESEHPGGDSHPHQHKGDDHEHHDHHHGHKHED